MNVELLRKVEKHILEEPKRLYMRSWIVREDHARVLITHVGETRGFAQCGTAACIAGWAVLLSHENTENELRLGMDVYYEARTLLGLNTHEADRLFDPIGWPRMFDAGTRDDGSEIAAETTVERIEHFIETGGRE
jgi:hypothetical protein